MAFIYIESRYLR